MKSLTKLVSLITTLSIFFLTIPLAIAADVARGKAIYNEKCALCHGRMGKGDGPVADSLKPRPPSFISKEMIAHPDARHKAVMMEGRGNMPSFQGQLSEEEIEDVLAYTRTLAK
ncbi:MAG: cytochrome c [candidate division NC10 bacterium]|nr:cytochrome c [candidate division NC10 bacterium]